MVLPWRGPFGSATKFLPTKLKKTVTAERTIPAPFLCSTAGNGSKDITRNPVLNINGLDTHIPTHFCTWCNIFSNIFSNVQMLK
jgi:hypothetical protein